MTSPTTCTVTYISMHAMAYGGLSVTIYSLYFVCMLTPCVSFFYTDEPFAEYVYIYTYLIFSVTTLPPSLVPFLLLYFFLLIPCSLCRFQSTLRPCLLGGVYVPCIYGVIVGDSGLYCCGPAFSVWRQLFECNHFPLFVDSTSRPV